MKVVGRHSGEGGGQSGAQAHRSAREIAVRLFLTCWIIYALHFSTNIVREIYLTLSIGDHVSFRVDEYAGLHPDLFEKAGYGWHIGSNPGVSMLAAVPYAAARPVIDIIVHHVREGREQKRQTPPEYDSPWPMARTFYEESWKRGYDVKFALGSFVMQVLCMAPSSALGVVTMFLVLQRLLLSERTALWLALLYAFGTPVFFRTGYLNHNLMLGHIAFWGFLLIWNPFGWSRESLRARYGWTGVAGGTALLFDYSGGIFLIALCLYGFVKAYQEESFQAGVQLSVWYALGALGPVCVLWFYQWQSFGHPFFPGQHWMPPVQWIERGYQGFGWPQFELLTMLLFDYRYGLFITSPLMLVAFVAVRAASGATMRLASRELWFILITFAALWLFFGGVNYTRLQFNTGIRYLSPIFPFLFIPVAVTLAQWSERWVLLIGVVSVAQNWALAMYRDVERGLGVLDPLVHVFAGGFQLPLLTTVSRFKVQFGDVFVNGPSPLPLFVLTGALLYVIWCARSEPM
jgi:hypothetical protein